MSTFEFELTAAIPEIGGLPGDVLVWQDPRVFLVRRDHNSAAVTNLRLFPSYWTFLFSKYEDRLFYLEPDAPPLALLAERLSRARWPHPSRTAAAPAPEPELRAEEMPEVWPGPPDHDEEPQPRQPLLRLLK